MLLIRAGQKTRWIQRRAVTQPEVTQVCLWHRLTHGAMGLLHFKLLALRNKGIRTLGATLMVLLFFAAVFFLVLLRPSNTDPPDPLSTSSLSDDAKHTKLRELFAKGSARDKSFTGDGSSENTGNNDENIGLSDKENTQTITGGSYYRNNDFDNGANSERRHDHDAKEQNSGTSDIGDGKARRVNEKIQTAEQTKGSFQSKKTDFQTYGQVSAKAEDVDTSPNIHPDNDSPNNISQFSSFPQPSNLLQASKLAQSSNIDARSESNIGDLGVSSSLQHFQILGSNLEILPFQSFPSPFIESEQNTDKSANKKVIMWYRNPKNPDQQKSLQNKLNRKRKLMKNCPDVRCRVVSPPLPQGVRADAVMFDDVDMTSSPPVRSHAEQVYVFRQMTPSHPSFPNHPHPYPTAWPNSWQFVFNWTWSYRRDSQIWQPLGMLTAAEEVPPLDHFITLAERKTRAAAWMPRTCPTLGQTSSNRNAFVQELRSYLPVVEFGSCTENTCSKGNASCSEVLSGEFFFLLALEDDICMDYITEVFYRAWQEETFILPVVRGGGNYAMYFPQGTYVDADWFDSVRHLYDFLSRLMVDRKLYAQLLWRKSHWVKVKRKTEEMALCRLCYKLHRVNASPRTFLDIRKWSERSACKVQS